MYTLNNNSPPLERCTVCRTVLQSIGSQPYCPQCQTIANNGVLIEKQMKVVPSMYTGNHAGSGSGYSSQSNHKRMEGYLLEYANLYTGISTLDQMDHFIVILTRMHMHSGKPSRHLKESAAAIIYHQFKSIHKLTLREFCHKCMLKERIVGEKYRLYYKLFIKRETNTTPVKKQHRAEVKTEENAIYEEEDSSQGYHLQLHQPQPNAQKTIRLIFNDVFPKFYFLSKKELLITHLIRKIEQIHPVLSHNPIPYPSLPYILYAILKHSCHKISIKRYREIIQLRTGYKIKSKSLGKVSAWYAENGAGFQSQSEERPTEEQEGVKQQEQQDPQQQSISEST